MYVKAGKTKNNEVQEAKKLHEDVELAHNSLCHYEALSHYTEHIWFNANIKKYWFIQA